MPRGDMNAGSPPASLSDAGEMPRGEMTASPGAFTGNTADGKPGEMPRGAMTQDAATAGSESIELPGTWKLTLTQVR